MQIVLIAAVAENGVIGRGGTMPWRLKSDMRHFRALTMGKPVVMGRKTYRVDRDQAAAGAHQHRGDARSRLSPRPGVLVAPSLRSRACKPRAAMRCGAAPSIMVIGGGDIYAQAMPLADRLEITQIHMRSEGDTVFPAIDPAVWREAAREPHPAGPDDDAAYDFVSYRRGASGA